VNHRKHCWQWAPGSTGSGNSAPILDGSVLTPYRGAALLLAVAGLLVSCQQIEPDYVTAIAYGNGVEGAPVLPSGTVPGRETKRLTLSSSELEEIREEVSSGNLAAVRARVMGPRDPGNGAVPDVLVLVGYQTHEVNWTDQQKWCAMHSSALRDHSGKCIYASRARFQYKASLKHDVLLGVTGLVTGHRLLGDSRFLVSDGKSQYDGFSSNSVISGLITLATLGMSNRVGNLVSSDQDRGAIAKGLEEEAVDKAQDWLEDQLGDLPSKWKSGRDAVKAELLAQLDAMERRLPADYAGVISDVDDLRAQPVAVLVAERLDATKVLAEESRTQVREARAKAEREALAAKAKAEREALAARLDGILALLPSRWREAERRFAQLRRDHPALPFSSGREIQGWIALKRFQSLCVMDGDNGTIAGHLERIARAFKETPAAAEARRLAAKRRAASSQ